jgi:hypothetical protein
MCREDVNLIELAQGIGLHESGICFREQINNFKY